MGKSHCLTAHVWRELSFRLLCILSSDLFCFVLICFWGDEGGGMGAFSFPWNSRTQEVLGWNMNPLFHQGMSNRVSIMPYALSLPLCLSVAEPWVDMAWNDPGFASVLEVLVCYSHRATVSQPNAETQCHKCNIEDTLWRGRIECVRLSFALR